MLLNQFVINATPLGCQDQNYFHTKLLLMCW